MSDKNPQPRTVGDKVFIGKTSWVKCPRCDGTGLAVESKTVHDPDGSVRVIESELCSQCCGTSMVKEEKGN